MTVSLERLVEEVAARLESADLFYGHGTDNPRDEAAWLVAHVADIDLAEVDDLPWERQLGADVQRRARELAERRIASRRPLAYLINEAWFAGLKFHVDERVIVPRSHLGEWIPDRFEPWIRPGEAGRILDLCTGSGCIAIAAAMAFPEAQVDAADLSAEALEVAEINVRNYRLEQRVRLCRGDLFDAVGDSRYDLILCNPPYVASAVMAELPAEYGFEPPLAFDGGALGLDLIDRILADAPRHLEPGGSLIVEPGTAGPAAQARYPELPLNWLSVSSGDELVFEISTAALERFARGADD